MKINEILEKEVEYLFTLPISDNQAAHLFMLFYRFLSFDSQLYILLHGSTAVTKRGNAILFGDGVDCLGKTTTSVFVAHDSGKYVVDECSLFNQATGNVYGNKRLPIHIRKPQDKIFEKRFDMKLNANKKFGCFVLPEKLGLDVLETAKLKAIVSPRLVPGRSRLVEEKNPLLKSRKIAIVANAHHLKFSIIGLDRVDGKTDNVKKVEMVDYTIGYTVPDLLMEIPYYDAYLKKSEDITNLLESEGL